MSSVLFKTEDAFEAIINAATGLTAIPTHRGSENEELVLPLISILAESAEERQPRGYGNYLVNVRIELQTSADDKDRDQRIALTENLLSAIEVTNLKDLLTAAVSQYTVFGCVHNNQQQRVGNRTNIYALEIRVDCCNS